MIISLNHFTNPNGERVSQVFSGGLPITRELDDERARHSAWDAFSRQYLRGVVLQEWDGDAGTTVELARK